jgi:hypothetical protein
LQLVTSFWLMLMLIILLKILFAVTLLLFFATLAMLSSGCKLNLLIKQIWLKLESKDPLLVPVYQ